MSEHTVEGTSSSSALATGADAPAQNLQGFIRSAVQALQDPDVIDLVKDLGRRGSASAFRTSIRPPADSSRLPHTVSSTSRISACRSWMSATRAWTRPWPSHGGGRTTGCASPPPAACRTTS